MLLRTLLKSAANNRAGLAAVFGALWMYCVAAEAQMRPDQSPVIEPEARPKLPTEPDTASAFRQRYEASGRPRVMIFWNRTISDRTADETYSQERHEHFDRTTSGFTGRDGAGAAAGGPTTKESSGTSEGGATDSMTSGVIDVGAGKSAPAARTAIVLEQSFIQTLSRAGVRLVDRSLALRTTAARQPGGKTDARQTAEARALLEMTDIVLEVLIVEDTSTQTGFGFDLRAKRVSDGTLIGTAYSLGNRAPRLAVAGSWVAGESGYQYRQPAPAGTPSPVEVGASIGDDALRLIAQSLPQN